MAHVDGPAVLDVSRMVVAAEQDEVVEVGGSAGLPFVDVVAFGPFGWDVTTGEGAAAVPCDEGVDLVGVARRLRRP